MIKSPVLDVPSQAEQNSSEFKQLRAEPSFSARIGSGTPSTRFTREIHFLTCYGYQKINNNIGLSRNL